MGGSIGVRRAGTAGGGAGASRASSGRRLASRGSEPAEILHPLGCVPCFALSVASGSGVPQCGAVTLHTGVGRTPWCSSGCPRHASGICAPSAHPVGMWEMPRVLHPCALGLARMDRFTPRPSITRAPPTPGCPPGIHHANHRWQRACSAHIFGSWGRLRGAVAPWGRVPGWFARMCRDKRDAAGRLCGGRGAFLPLLNPRAFGRERAYQAFLNRRQDAQWTGKRGVMAPTLFGTAPAHTCPPASRVRNQHARAGHRTAAWHSHKG